MQYKAIKRDNLLSYLDDYSRRGSATLFVARRGLRHVRWSYQQLVFTARQVACELRKYDVQEGDRVILCGDNGPEWAAAFWACLLVGAVVVPLDYESKAEFVYSVVRQTNAKLIIADHLLANRPTNLARLRLDTLLEKVRSHPTAALITPNAHDSTLAQIIFTSGTTSIPKGVMLTHGNMLANLLPL